MATILDGKKVRAERKIALVKRIADMDTRTSMKSTPKLAIIQVGDREDSTAFIRAKRAFAKEIGVGEVHIQIPKEATQLSIVERIHELNADKSVHGIIVQLPLPPKFDRDAVIGAIDPKKDVDGLTSKNVNAWLEGREDAMYPATARGVGELLDFYGIDLFGKQVTVIGRSMLVGKPVSAMCLNRNATVTVCHRKTQNIAELARRADVLIVAAGTAKLVKKDFVHEGQVVIDIGISPVQGKFVGDVDFDAVREVIGEKGAITPVPGGVGQMTVLALFENLVDAWYNQVRS